MFHYTSVKVKFTRNDLLNHEEHIKSYNTARKNGYVQSKRTIQHTNHGLQSKSASNGISLDVGTASSIVLGST